MMSKTNIPDNFIKAPALTKKEAKSQYGIKDAQIPTKYSGQFMNLNRMLKSGDK